MTPLEVHKKCNTCNKVGKQTKAISIPTQQTILRTLECGHLFKDILVSEEDKYQVVSEDGKELYPFQKQSVKIIEKAGGRAIIAHEPGLGKTVIALATLKLHPEFFPVAILCKGNLKFQWFQECIRWLQDDAYLPLIVENSKHPPSAKFKVYIISLDLLRNVKWLDKLPVNSVIVDECQMIKNRSAARTQAVDKLQKGKPFFLGMSGTPIKNHAGEYYPVLHMTRPDLFPTEDKFYFEWIDFYTDQSSGIVRAAGIKKERVEAFHKLTSSFVHRCTREEVLPDLPKINRNFRFTDLGKDVGEEYLKELGMFEKAMQEWELRGDDTKSNLERWGKVSGSLNTMRHIVGRAKVKGAVDYVADFLMGTESIDCPVYRFEETGGVRRAIQIGVEKRPRPIVLFVHHKGVGQRLYEELSKLCKEGGYAEPLRLTSDMTMEKRAQVDLEFRTDKSKRILIASTLASGEGLNWQHCQDVIMLERQWNPANEEQAEGRFPRIGSIASSINAVYMVALGTVDEIFAELVEKKRRYFNITMTQGYCRCDMNVPNDETGMCMVCHKVIKGKALNWNESSIMRQLAEELLAKRRKSWGGSKS